MDSATLRYYSNHAQAVALSAQILDIPATIVMPHDASPAKLAATRGYGATVVGYDRYKDDALAIAQGLAAEHGMRFIPPFDHPDVLSGAKFPGVCRKTAMVRVRVVHWLPWTSPRHVGSNDQ
jgi:hypothetical protein